MLFHRAAALTVLTLQIGNLAAQCTASWTGNTSSDWSTASNWDSCLPNGDADIANFTASASTTSVTLSAPITINQVNFLTDAASYNISNNYLNFAGTNPQLNVTSGTQAISSNITSTSNLAFNINGTLNYSGQVLSGTTPQIILEGIGTLNSSSFAVFPDAFVMNSGTLVNSGAFCGTFGFPTNSINISGGNLTNQSSSSFGEQAVDFTISGGTFNNAGVFAQYAQNLTITGGDFTNTSQFANSATYIEIDGGTFNLPTPGAALGNFATTILINGGSFSVAGSGATSIGQFASTLTINGGTFNQTDNSVLGNNAGVVNISGGDFLFTNSAQLALFTNSITISGGTFNIEGNSNLGSFASSSLTIEGNPIFNITTESVIGEGTPIIMSGGTINVTNNIDTQFPSSLNMSGGTIFVDSISSWFSPIAMTGGTIINDGLITPSGTLTMTGSSLIQGTGTFAGDLSNGGTVSPGDPGSVGTLTIEGAYTQTPNGTLLTTVKNSSASLLVAQAATLSGTLDVFSLPGFVPQGQTFTIVDAAGGVSGTFSKITTGGFDSLLFAQVDYLPDSVLLTLSPALPSYIGRYNQMVFSSINQINFMVFRHLEWVRDNLFCKTDCCGNLVCCNPHTLNFYAGPLGSVGQIQKRSESAQGVRYNSIGGIVGFDYALTNVLIGVEVDYQRFNGRGKEHFGKVGIDQVHSNLYGSYDPIRNLSLDFLVGGGYDWVDIHRNINNLCAKGRPDASLFDALIGAQYTISAFNSADIPPSLHLIPMASLQYISIKAKSYDETQGGVFNVHYDRQTLDSLRSLVGFRANWMFNSRCFSIIPEVNVALQNELLKQNKNLSVALPYSGQLSTLEVSGLGRNILLAGIDLQILFRERFGLEATYEFEGNERYQNHFFYVGINGEF